MRILPETDFPRAVATEQYFGECRFCRTDPPFSPTGFMLWLRREIKSWRACILLTHRRHPVKTRWRVLAQTSQPNSEPPDA